MRFWLLLIFAALVLAGCAPVPLVPVEDVAQAASASATPTVRRTATTAVPTAQPTATVPPPPTAPPSATSTPACNPVLSAGTTISITIPSGIFPYDSDARVYLPPCYETLNKRYPVLYMLHGQGFRADQWERVGLLAAADKLIASGQIAPLIIVLPWERKDERFDPALVKEIVPYMDANYRTYAQREARAVGGLSRGGGWAVHFALRYPEVFSRAGLHSPAVFYGDENNLLEWVRQLKNKPKPVFYIDSGENDATLRSPLWLGQVFTWSKIEHTLVVQAGGHTENYWAAHVQDYLKFYAADWRAENFAPPEVEQLTP
jgi:enterochelin esterase-like enzyme